MKKSQTFCTRAIGNENESESKSNQRPAAQIKKSEYTNRESSEHVTYLLACFAITLSSGAPKLDISAPNSNRRRAASSRSPCSGRFRFHYRHAGHPTTRSQTIQTAPETIERLTITNNRYRPKAAFPFIIFSPFLCINCATGYRPFFITRHTYASS